MASVSGSKLAFFAPGLDPSLVNVVLTPDGTGALPVAGKFNIEVFTAASGTTGAGFQAGAVLQGATLINNNTVEVGGPLTLTEQLLAGTYTVLDYGVNSKGLRVAEDIRIVGGASGSSITVVGSAGDTITGSSFGATSQTIDLSGANALTAKGAMTVIGGAGNTTVIAGSSDVIVGGTGKLGVDGNAGDSNSVVGGAGNLEAFNFGSNNTVIGGSGATFIDDGYGAGGNNSITGGSGPTTFIQGGTGDVLQGGSGVITVLNSFTFGSQTVAGGSGFSTLISGGKDDVIFAGGGKSVFISAGTDATITGGTNTGPGTATNVFSFGARDSIVGQAGALNVGGDGTAKDVTIHGGAGNLFVVNLGTNNTVTGSTAGTTFINDVFGAGGNSRLEGGAAGSTILGGANSTVVAGTGKFEAWVVTGVGAETVNLSASGTADIVRDIDGGTAATNATVTGFSTANDTIASATSVTSGGVFTGSSISDGAGGTILTFVDGSTMTLALVSDPTKITFTQ